MIKRQIYKLRQKSKESRDRFAFGVALTFTAAVFAVWAYHAPAKLTAVLGFGSQADVENPGAFSGVFDQLGEQVSSVGESFRGESEAPEDVSETDAWKAYLEQNAAERAAATAVSARSATETASTTATSTPIIEASSSSTSAAPRPIRIVTTSSSSATTTITQ